MEKDFENFKNWQSWLWLWIKWFFWLLFRPILDIYKLFYKEIIQNIRNKKWKDFWLAIIPLLLIVSFILYWFNWIKNDIYKWWNHDRYEQVLIKDYKQGIENFFNKYEERFLAHDCWFMREVWADELMYDKYWRTSYWEDYNCSIFDTVQRLKLFPISIWEIEIAWDKYKVRWEFIRVEITNWKPLTIIPMRFELWKTLEMDLWHFNVYWDAKTRFLESKLQIWH